MKNVQYSEEIVQTLPYRGPDRKNRRQSVRPRRFSVMVPVDGVEVKLGHTYTTLARAVSRAQEASIQYGYATVLDNSRTIAQRLVALCRKGLATYIEGENLHS